MESRMKESYVEGLATHGDPESCVSIREGAGEALAGAHVGEVLSREIKSIGVPTLLSDAEGNTVGGVMASLLRTPRGRRPSACVEALCTGTGRSHIRPQDDGCVGRIGKAKAATR